MLKDLYYFLTFIIILNLNFCCLSIHTPLSSPTAEQDDALSPYVYPSLSTDRDMLIDKLKEIEEEMLDSWKIVRLSYLLSEQEQLAALDKAVQNLILETSDTRLQVSLDDARTTTSSGERLSKLNYLLGSPKKLIEAYTQKVREKIYVTE